jgi:DNA-binding response OmpR family regulator
MPSRDFDNALVVSSSKVIQDLIGRFLRDHATAVSSALSIEEATRQTGVMDASSIVVLDADIDDQGGLELFESLAAAENTNRPAFVVITGKPNLELETRASLLGAIGWLTKPVSLPKLSAILRRSSSTFVPAAQRLRARPLGEVVLLDDAVGAGTVKWVIEDISESGAFLRSFVEYEPGTLLPMELHLGQSRISVEARVVRSQASPLQSDVGIGVQFELDSRSRVALQRSLSELASSDRVDMA